MGRGGSGGGGFSGGGFRSSGSSFRSSGSSFRSSSSSRGGGSFGSSGRNSGGSSFSSSRISSSHRGGNFSSNPIYNNGSTPRPGPGAPTPHYYGTPYRSSGSGWLFPYLVGRQAGKNDAYRQQYYSNIGQAAPSSGTYNAAPGTGQTQSGTYTPPPQQSQPVKRGLGCLGWFLIGLMIFFALGIIGMASESSSGPTRTALDNTGSFKVVIEDETGILKEDMSSLKSGLNDFKTKTGVVPAVMTMYEDQFSENMADQIFDELDLSEYHFLLIYLVNQIESEEDSYYYIAGDGTHTVLDDEAIGTFEDQLAYYYNDLDLSYSEFIGKSFSTTAEKIMYDGSDNTTSIIICSVLFLICLAGLILMMSRDRRLRKQELDLQQQKLDAEILNTPLEQFSTAQDSTVEDLKKKYD